MDAYNSPKPLYNNNMGILSDHCIVLSPLKHAYYVPNKREYGLNFFKRNVYILYKL